MEQPQSNSQKEREVLQSTLPSDEELVALHKKLMNTPRMSLEEKYDIVKKLLDSYDAKEKELEAYRRGSAEDVKKYKDQYKSTHALREMYAGMLKRIQLAGTTQPMVENLAHAPAKVLLHLADKLQKETGLAGFDVSRMGENHHMNAPSWASQHPETYATAQVLSNIFLDPVNWVAGALGRASSVVRMSSSNSAWLLRGSLRKLDGSVRLLDAVQRRVGDIIVKHIRNRAPELARIIEKQYVIRLTKIGPVQEIADLTAMQTLALVVKEASQTLRTELTQKIHEEEPDIPIDIIRTIVAEIDLMSALKG